jgi:demethylmenaquinone methyltransferase / 2-methoxy-6-polyprenyl-1,4-benzoquinol methylase
MNGRVAGSGAMFDAIAERYDFTNRIISLGSDQRWRRRAVRALELRPGARVLDVATGTSDLAILVAEMHPDARVSGVDTSERMLHIGRAKVLARGLDARVELHAGDAQSLAWPDATFDGALVAFGIRNVPDRPRALAEMVRVVRPGGRIVVLELSEPRGRGGVAALARWHIHSVVPAIGAVLSGAPEYRYLARSIAAFPPNEEFLALLERAGCDDARAVPLTLGVATLFVARSKGVSRARA